MSTLTVICRECGGRITEEDGKKKNTISICTRGHQYHRDCFAKDIFLKYHDDIFQLNGFRCCSIKATTQQLCKEVYDYNEMYKYLNKDERKKAAYLINKSATPSRPSSATTKSTENTPTSPPDTSRESDYQKSSRGNLKSNDKVEVNYRCRGKWYNGKITMSDNNSELQRGLMSAAQLGDMKNVRLYLSRGANILQKDCPTMSSSRPDTAATNRDVDSRENIDKFLNAEEATTYDNLLLDGRISNADIRDDDGMSGLHLIPVIGRDNEDIDTDMLLFYLLTCDPPADVNGRSRWGYTPLSEAAFLNNTNAVKVLIDFSGDRTIKTRSDIVSDSNKTPLDRAKERNNQETIELLTECFPSEE